MKRKGTKYQMWTKDEVKRLVSLWEGKTLNQISEEMERPRAQVVAMAARMRRVGFKLPKKHRLGYLDNLLKEVKADLKTR